MKSSPRGGIVIEPFDAGADPAVLDRPPISRLFRVFRNDTAAVIDAKRDRRHFTELVESPVDGSGP